MTIHKPDDCSLPFIFCLLIHDSSVSTDPIILKLSIPVERGDNFDILIFRSQKFVIYMFSKLAYHDYKAYMLTKDSHPNLHTPHVSQMKCLCTRAVGRLKLRMPGRRMCMYIRRTHLSPPVGVTVPARTSHMQRCKVSQAELGTQKKFGLMS